jgi:hypothetical protein
MIDVQKANIDYTTVFENMLGSEKFDLKNGENT